MNAETNKHPIFPRPQGENRWAIEQYDEEKGIADRFTAKSIQCHLVDAGGWPILMVVRGAVWYYLNKHKGHTKHPMWNLSPEIPGGWPNHHSLYPEDMPNKFSLGALTVDKVEQWMDYADKVYKNAQNAYNAREQRRGEARGLYDSLPCDSKWEGNDKFTLHKGHARMEIDKDHATIVLNLHVNGDRAIKLWNILPGKE